MVYRPFILCNAAPCSVYFSHTSLFAIPHTPIWSCLGLCACCSLCLHTVPQIVTWLIFSFDSCLFSKSALQKILPDYFIEVKPIHLYSFSLTLCPHNIYSYLSSYYLFAYCRYTKLEWAHLEGIHFVLFTIVSLHMESCLTNCQHLIIFVKEWMNLYLSIIIFIHFLFQKTWR